jgi:hypothetical protein
MFKLASTLHKVGYPYMLMPDHAPSHPDTGKAYNSRYLTRYILQRSHLHIHSPLPEDTPFLLL